MKRGTRQVLLVTATTNAPEQCMAAAVEITAYFRQVLATPSSGCGETTDPQQADLILFVEPPSEKPRSHIDVLRSHPLIRKFPSKCFTYDGEDLPQGYLPGAYPSMSRRTLNHTRLRCGTRPRILDVRNLEADAAAIAESSPGLLFQFMGYQSSAVRKTLFKWALPPGPWMIEHTYAWCDHTPQQRQAFAWGILRAKFGLCPRGIGVASYRLFQTMALGRAPVILADDWLPFAGPEWDAFSIRIRERDYKSIPRILAEREPERREMGRRAWEAHQKWCTPRAAAAYVLERITELQASPARLGFSPHQIPQHWNTRTFRWRRGWTTPQTTAKRVRAVVPSVADGSFPSTLRRRLSGRHT